MRVSSLKSGFVSICRMKSRGKLLVGAIVYDTDNNTAVFGDHVVKNQWIAWITLGVRSGGLEPSAIGKCDLHARRPCRWILRVQFGIDATGVQMVWFQMVWLTPVIWFGTETPWGGASCPSASPSTTVGGRLSELRGDVGGEDTRARPVGGLLASTPAPFDAAAKVVPAAIGSWMVCAAAWLVAMMKFRHSWVTSARWAS